MHGENRDCPIRITCCSGFSRKVVEDASDKLIKEFGWKHHSWGTLETTVYPGVQVHTRILFHTGNTGEAACQKTS